MDFKCTVHKSLNLFQKEMGRTIKEIMQMMKQFSEQPQRLEEKLDALSASKPAHPKKPKVVNSEIQTRIRRELDLMAINVSCNVRPPQFNFLFVIHRPH